MTEHDHLPPPPPIAPPPTPSPSTGPNSFRVLLIVVGAIVALGIVVSVVNPFAIITDRFHHDRPSTAPGGSTSAGASGNAVGDVTIVQCGDKRGPEAEFGYPTADVEIRNSSGSVASYTFTISFESPDGSAQLTTQDSFVTDLGPGQTKTENVLAWEDVHTTDYECRVSSAERS